MEEIQMVNQKIQDRLAALRRSMKENGVDWYMVPTADFHNSEYVDAYFKVREYLCNFSGSNGTLIVGMDEAGLWTDGRYFIQAAKQIEGTTVEMMKMNQPGVRPSTSIWKKLSARARRLDLTDVSCLWETGSAIRRL